MLGYTRGTLISTNHLPLHGQRYKNSIRGNNGCTRTCRLGLCKIDYKTTSSRKATSVFITYHQIIQQIRLNHGRVAGYTASMAEWLRAWDTLATMKLRRREVVSSIPVRGTIVGVFSPTRQLIRFSHLNMPSFKILNLFRILLSPWGSGNYRLPAPFLYEVASHVKKLPFRRYYYYYI